MTLAEEIRTFVVGPTEHDEIKRLIRQAAPTIKSSHCAEAVARGFQFLTNAALLTELKDSGKFERSPDRVQFESFLAERGYDVEKLQVSLFLDAVRLATNSRWQPSLPDKYTDVLRCRFRICVSCKDEFPSEGPHNKLCIACHIRNGRVCGINHLDSIRHGMRCEAFTNGTKSWNRYKARPGWTDFLESKKFKSDIARLIKLRDQVRGGNFRGLPRDIKSLFNNRGYLEVMDELRVPRKTAEAFYHEGKTSPLDEIELDDLW